MFDIDGDRARKVITRGPRRSLGRFPSLKTGRTIHWESQLERDLVYLLEFDRDVLRYREQPETIELQIGGRRRRYTPDFIVAKPNGKYIVEVKPSGKAAEAEWQQLFGAVREVLGPYGIAFEVLTEAEIRIQPRLANIAWLIRHRGQCVPEDARQEMLSLAGSGSQTLGDLSSEARAFGLNKTAVLALMGQHELTADLDRPLNDDSVIYRAEPRPCQPSL